MTKLACRYAIIQFMPYPETGEFANVGIALACPKTGFFDFRLEKRKYARVTSFFDELDGQVYKRSVYNFNAELNRIKLTLSAQFVSPDELRENFDHLVRPREAIVRFGNARVLVTESPEKTLNQLFDYYVGRNFVTKEYQETQLAKRVASIVNSLDLKLPFREDKIGSQDYAVTFPLVQTIPNFGVAKLIKPLYLGQDEPNKIYTHGDGWIAKISRLHKLGFLPSQVLFTIKMPDGAHERRIAAAKSIEKELKNLGVYVVDSLEKDKIVEFASS
ncbi:DUF3037 domain-containing protein [Chromobacterium violaceum]|uniref:DUF3037 domain-containing protein n=1 Tax=Chromobacterium violaceum TaxID=536 RepID=A0A202BD70_CHRVL|nr:DUF3037 domain-containing protein [Chromobacterium violaceum]OVE49428.1 hypothetical protein CBW21_05970 [Chromobacterium violaceum]